MAKLVGGERHKLSTGAYVAVPGKDDLFELTQQYGELMVSGIPPVVLGKAEARSKASSGYPLDVPYPMPVVTTDATGNLVVQSAREEAKMLSKLPDSTVPVLRPKLEFQIRD
jgi:hypothetical protein